MKITTIPFAILLSLCPSLAQAQVNLHIDIGLPVAPPLVEVEPGIQVVEGFQEEVFFHDGWYWCRRPEGWYRAHSPRERFDRMNSHRVPWALRREPMGHYRDWHHDEGHGRSNDWQNARHEEPGQGYGRPERSYERQGPGHGGRDTEHDRGGSRAGRGRRPLLPPQNP
jgi:hypothetical protein